ncbi:MAG: pilus assembly protein [Chloroflexi bacterium]|nr:pilus assembly protein [Chloroflexota bacterium]
MRTQSLLPKRPSRSQKRGPAGQSLVEFALLLPILMIIFVGVLDLGRMYNAYMTIQNASREGARYGSDRSTDVSGIRAAVRAEAANSGITITDAMIPAPTVQNDGTFRDPPNNTQPNQSITVQVNYPFSLITTFLLAGQQTIPISANTTMQVK